MTSRIFISFDHDDAAQVNGFRGLIDNPQHPLDAYDRSLTEPVVDAYGRPIKVRPSDPRAAPVKREIIRRFDTSSRLVVLIGDDTHSSEWVAWEIETFYNLKHPLSGDRTWKRMRGMWLKGRTGGKPAALAGRSTPAMEWDPVALDRWLDEPI